MDLSLSTIRAVHHSLQLRCDHFCHQNYPLQPGHWYTGPQPRRAMDLKLSSAVPASRIHWRQTGFDLYYVLAISRGCAISWFLGSTGRRSRNTGTERSNNPREHGKIVFYKICNDSLIPIKVSPMKRQVGTCFMQFEGTEICWFPFSRYGIVCK